MQVIKTTTEIRLEEGADLEAFHRKMQQQAEDGGYTLTNYSYAEKTKKSGGEIVELWYIVKVTFVFNDPKDIDKDVDIIYTCSSVYGGDLNLE